MSGMAHLPLSQHLYISSCVVRLQWAMADGRYLTRLEDLTRKDLHSPVMPVGEFVFTPEIELVVTHQTVDDDGSALRYHGFVPSTGFPYWYEWQKLTEVSYETSVFDDPEDGEWRDLEVMVYSLGTDARAACLAAERGAKYRWNDAVKRFMDSRDEYLAQRGADA